MNNNNHQRNRFCARLCNCISRKENDPVFKFIFAILAVLLKSPMLAPLGPVIQPILAWLNRKYPGIEHQFSKCYRIAINMVFIGVISFVVLTLILIGHNSTIRNKLNNSKLAYDTHNQIASLLLATEASIDKRKGEIGPLGNYKNFLSFWKDEDFLEILYESYVNLEEINNKILDNCNELSYINYLDSNASSGVIALLQNQDNQYLLNLYDKDLNLVDDLNMSKNLNNNLSIKKAIFSRRNKILVIATKDGKLIFYKINFDNNKNHFVLLGTNISAFGGISITDISLSPNEDIFSVSGPDAKTTIFKFQELEFNSVDSYYYTMERASNAIVYSSTFSPDQNFFALLSGDGTINIWNIENLNSNNRIINQMELSNLHKLDLIHNNPPRFIKFINSNTIAVFYKENKINTYLLENDTKVKSKFKISKMYNPSNKDNNVIGTIKEINSFTSNNSEFIISSNLSNEMILWQVYNDSLRYMGKEQLDQNQIYINNKLSKVEHYSIDKFHPTNNNMIIGTNFSEHKNKNFCQIKIIDFDKVKSRHIFNQIKHGGPINRIRASVSNEINASFVLTLGEDNKIKPWSRKILGAKHTDISPYYMKDRLNDLIFDEKSKFIVTSEDFHLGHNHSLIIFRDLNQPYDGKYILNNSIGKTYFDNSQQYLLALNSNSNYVSLYLFNDLLVHLGNPNYVSEISPKNISQLFPDIKYYQPSLTFNIAQPLGSLSNNIRLLCNTSISNKIHDNLLSVFIKNDVINEPGKVFLAYQPSNKGLNPPEVINDVISLGCGVNNFISLLKKNGSIYIYFQDMNEYKDKIESDKNPYKIIDLLDYGKDRSILAAIDNSNKIYIWELDFSSSHFMRKLIYTYPNQRQASSIRLSLDKGKKSLIIGYPNGEIEHLQIYSHDELINLACEKLDSLRKKPVICTKK